MCKKVSSHCFVDQFIDLRSKAMSYFADLGYRHLCSCVSNAQNKRNHLKFEEEKKGNKFFRLYKHKITFFRRRKTIKQL